SGVALSFCRRHLLKTRSDLIKLDRTKINPEGVVAANLEPCDFYSNDKHFIHLKDGESSGPISHLWMQGVVSAEAFVADSEFRRKLKDTVAATKGGSAFVGTLPDGRKRDVDRGEYTVVYGIMRHRYVDGTIGIPFFSKVSLMAACDRLRRTGMNIRKEIIEKLTPKPPVKKAKSKRPTIKAKKTSSAHKRPAAP
ncbi:TIGR04141 family sporadically distributed protein, partial [Pseudomonas avellanae]|uniref:TIGR04141 family sporadically distributed protein n=1 Tax=Pseudomonas avellanae TaxID=46257 RepID=UPI000516650F